MYNITVKSISSFLYLPVEESLAYAIHNEQLF